MTMRRPAQLEMIRLHRDTGPRTFVESGTFYGKTTRWAVEQFDRVHTIELSPPLAAAARRDLAPLGVTCHEGDSREIVPRLAREIAEPVFWFLDAHWFKRAAALAIGGQPDDLPLEAELRALAERPYADIVAVDDYHAFGTVEPDPGWAKVSLEWIGGFFRNPKEVTVIIDQAVVYR